MTWPGWSDVLPLLAAVLAAVAALVGGLAALARMARSYTGRGLLRRSRLASG